MKVYEIKEILDAEVICGEEFMDRDVFSACGSDMMSDVLAYVKEQAALLSGLVNPQVRYFACRLRTASMPSKPASSLYAPFKYSPLILFLSMAIVTSLI